MREHDVPMMQTEPFWVLGNLTITSCYRLQFLQAWSHNADVEKNVCNLFVTVTYVLQELYNGQQSSKLADDNKLSTSYGYTKIKPPIMS